MFYAGVGCRYIFGNGFVLNSCIIKPFCSLWSIVIKKIKSKLFIRKRVPYQTIKTREKEQKTRIRSYLENE
jgi:hypothetical protein